ncbi:MBL fold metallo-hydrolase [Sulfodiicoccus acidiphilus]|uniref:MBL fold metallo-hydrolase n=1 Tax=Sulfodiicoccus acidiphilus TaxID=1670455 RepID=A0A348B480_9CREN|nr:MBL fold metallo-hydrolase [Sulfodiicoccus acidiphilus]BBD72982.1 MBL fold metallo-hydrolase [Sulfodiicoccus acidiphilus]GGT87569.1 MBL fold metallo-hydrolase [Sulfodiicoccus acidiphilus]
MELTFLGTGAGATLGSSRFRSSILVASGAVGVLLDMGAGANLRLEDMGLTKSFQALFVTHTHLDHFNGLPDHLVLRKITAMPKLFVASPPGLGPVLSAMKAAGNDIEVELLEADLPRSSLGDVEVWSVPGCHSIYSVAYVVDDGKKRLLYSGDTREPCEPILRELKGVDLVVHESSCLEDCSRWGHTSVQEALNFFSGKRLVLTHIPSQIVKEAEQLVGGKAIIARDGLMIRM